MPGSDWSKNTVSTNNQVITPEANGEPTATRVSSLNYEPFRQNGSSC